MHRIDITQDRCPMTLVKVKSALSRLNSGETLEIILTGGEPLENIGPSLKMLGHEVSEPEKKEEFYSLEVKKA